LFDAGASLGLLLGDLAKTKRSKPMKGDSNRREAKKAHMIVMARWPKNK